jgi:protocatechuate 3,4-dioxygenase beta subunit
MADPAPTRATAEPPLDSPAYRSTRLRHPTRPLVYLPQQLTETTGPALGHLRPGAIENDLTRQHEGEPHGQRIIVGGRLLDAGGRPIRESLLEIWQANAAGRYRHRRDRWDAPLDPNFSGGGRTVTDAEGRYEFVTIQPGAYPWGNHPNAWRPAHIHFSVLGRSFEQRLVTQMYFPGDPLLAHDPIFEAVRDPAARRRLVSRFSLDRTRESWALGFEFDIVVGGRVQTPLDEAH